MRISYYNNFASHLLNAYNPNMLYPELRDRWTDEQWFQCLDMVSSFGYTAFEFWLEPRLFCRQGLEEAYGIAFTDQMRRIIDYAHTRNLQVTMLCSLATVGSDWRTLCPNIDDEWEELNYLWRSWLGRLESVDVVAIFPGDPGACSRNGCTAETYIDRSRDIAELAATRPRPFEVEFHTWGPPYFGWGLADNPGELTGAFSDLRGAAAWRFDLDRSNRSMEHLIAQLPNFPPNTSVGINLGFNPDGNPGGDDDARKWISEIAAQGRTVYSWDFSLTEGENAITPHWRFERLFSRRREERDTGAFSGGICFTMTPWVNQLSFYESARSFVEPDADPFLIASEFFSSAFDLGSADASEVARLYRGFEIIDDWGYYSGDPPSAERIHQNMRRLCEILRDVRLAASDGAAATRRNELCLFPDAETYRQELLFYAELYRDLSAPSPDYDALAKRFWQRVYAIYDELPEHVDPRPHRATDRFVARFANLSRTAIAKPTE